jgi:hypothetical protein
MPPTCFFERQTLVLSHLMRIRLGVAVLILLCKAVEVNVYATYNALYVQFCLTKIYRTCLPLIRCRSSGP